MTDEKEKTLNGEPYDPFDPVLVSEREHARALTRRFNETTGTDSETRRAVLEELFGSVGENVTVEPPFRCDYGYNRRRRLLRQLRLCDPRRVSGDVRRRLSARSRRPSLHRGPLDAVPPAGGVEWGEEIEVGDNVWIGGRAVVNPGVAIGDDAIVASNPARVKRKLD